MVRSVERFLSSILLMMKMLKCFLLSLAYVASSLLEVHAAECKAKSLCVCQTADGQLDLTPLQEKSQRFHSVYNDAYYEYQPCKLMEDCENALACRGTPGSDPVNYTALAYPDHYKFRTVGQKDFAIDYSVGNSTLTVSLICDPEVEANFTVMSTQPDQSYNFQLTSRYACIKKTPPTSSTVPPTTTTTAKQSTSVSTQTPTSSISTSSTSSSATTSPTTSSRSTSSTGSTGSSTKTPPGSSTTPSKLSSTTAKSTPTKPYTGSSTSTLKTTTAGSDHSRPSKIGIASFIIVLVWLLH